MLFATQLGGIYTLRLRMKPLVVDFTDDIFVQAVFIALYGVGLVILARRWPRLPLDRRALIALATFHAFVCVSSLWSDDVARTASQSILFTATSVAALAVGHVVSLRGFIWALFVSHQVGALISYRAVLAKWPGAIDEYLQWTGIYLNRNSLGPVATIGILASVFVLVDLQTIGRTGRRQAIACVAAALGVAVTVAIDCRLLVRSGSRTALVGVAVAVCALAVAVVMRRHGRNRPGLPVRSATAGVVVASVLVGVLAVRTTVSHALGKASDLNRRSDIWRVVWDQVRVHPVRGSGWLGAWSNLAFQDHMISRAGDRFSSAHNGYLEVALGLGIVGTVLFTWLVVELARSALGPMCQTGLGVMVPLMLMVYALVVNLGESFVGANLLPWVLIVGAAALGSGAARGLPAAQRCDTMDGS